MNHGDETKIKILIHGDLKKNTEHKQINTLTEININIIKITLLQPGDLVLISVMILVI